MKAHILPAMTAVKRKINDYSSENHFCYGSHRIYRDKTGKTVIEHNYRVIAYDRGKGVNDNAVPPGSEIVALENPFDALTFLAVYSCRLCIWIQLSGVAHLTFNRLRKPNSLTDIDHPCVRTSSGAAALAGVSSLGFRFE